MIEVQLYSADGEPVAIVLAPPIENQALLWGSRLFGLREDGKYYEATYSQVWTRDEYKEMAKQGILT